MVFSTPFVPFSVPLRGYECKPYAQKSCVLCEPGFYCPDEFEKIPCGHVNHFCRRGSIQPTLVSNGYYTSSGDEYHRSEQEMCEPGYFCNGGEKTACPEGHYCPKPGMTRPLECGDPSKFCRGGSIEPETVNLGYYSVGGSNITRSGQLLAPLGYYARNGIMLECPEGHYGDEEGLTDDYCSGICDSGWYCPSASVNSRQHACGGEEYFCPAGSSSAIKVYIGHFTSMEWEPCRPGMHRAKPDNDNVHPSPVGTIEETGNCVLCPDGTFKPDPGDSQSLCMACGPKAKSTQDRVTCECHQSATQKLLMKFHFNTTEKQCIDITNKAPPADVDFTRNSQLTKSKQERCPPGSYCNGGVRYLCPAGRYGDEHLEINSQCSGPCQAGYWCPMGSTSATEIECGMKPNVYCPESSAVPTYISEGYYANENDPEHTKTFQELCPPGSYCPGDGLKHKCPGGYFGQHTGLVSNICDGLCRTGYYCPLGSSSPYQAPCGNATVFCAEGSSRPLPVLSGYYSASSNNILTDKTRYAGPNSTQDISLLCEVGYYCKNGVKYQCPGGTFGSMEGASDVSQCRQCYAGFYCPSYPNPPTTVETMMACGQSYLFCPLGSSKPKDIDLGHYGISNFVYPGQKNDEGLEFIDRRTEQVLCPTGYYCLQGIRRKCRTGTYGETTGLVGVDCSGFCSRGYFCPEKTVRPLPCSPGAYSTGGASECMSCEVPLTVSMDRKSRMCRDDRSCCFQIFDSE